MVASVNQLKSDKNFWLKLISLIIFICLLAAAHQYYTKYITMGYIGTCCGISFALLIACILEKTTKLTELYLLIAVLVKVLIATIVFVIHYFSESSEYLRGVSTTDLIIHLVLSICAIIVIAVDVIVSAKK